jgi:hypothetical protein
MESSTLNVFKVTLIFEHNVGLPIKLNEKQLYDLVRKHSRPKWLMPRNFGWNIGDKQYVKVDLRRLMCINAELMGTEDVVSLGEK